MGAFTELKITESELAAKGMTSLSGTKFTNQADLLKAKMDEDGTFVAGRLGEVLDTLESAAAAGSIGAEPFGDYEATTVQGLIEETVSDLQGKIDDIVAGILPDDSIDTAKIKNGAVTAEKIASGSVTAAKIGADVTPSTIGAASAADVQAAEASSLIRDLNIMLNLSLGTSNIDAWADLLADSTRINTSASTAFSIGSGSISCSRIEQLTGGTNTQLGYDTSANKAKYGQTFTAIDTTLSSILVQLKKTGSPTDSVKMEIWSTSAGLPNTLLYTATNQIAGPDITTANTDREFLFSGVSLTVGNVYAFVLSRTGSLDTTNYYTINTLAGSGYAGGNTVGYGTSWAALTNDLYFRITAASATVVWNAVTATEVFTKMAVATEMTLGTGTITFYVSHNGTSWTQITALNASQVVSFTGTSVYLKAAITGNASLSGVAWGGY